MLKKYHIKTWGCQMNVYDSERIAEVLQSLNYEPTEDVTESDVVILNTCHIREKATEKVYSDIGRITKLKERRRKIGKDLIIAVSGCVAQAEGDEIIKRAPSVSLVFGPQTWHLLRDMLKKVDAQEKVVNTSFPVEEKFDSLPEYFDANRVKGSSAFIAIQEGCDKFCTYCVVPYTRGAEYSRPTWQILNEVSQLVNSGAKEITLLGQNVNAYHGLHMGNEEWTLGKLIRRLAENDKIQRIRYTTSYPAEVDDDLISAHKDVAKLMPLLHLPVQSGSNAILKAMNRKHTREAYLSLVGKLRAANSKLAFSSDFIVGFPGETDEDFQQTLDLIKEVGFIQAYSFSYSPRPGTPAANMQQLSEELKLERLHIMQNLLQEQQKRFNDLSVGQTFDVLLDRKGKLPAQLVGRSPYMQAVHINNISDNLLGSIVRVKIISATTNSLTGEMLSESLLDVA